jgi:hypothetical protein
MTEAERRYEGMESWLTKIDENQGGMQIKWWLCWEEEEMIDHPRSNMI